LASPEMRVCPIDVANKSNETSATHVLLGLPRDHISVRRTVSPGTGKNPVVIRTKKIYFKTLLILRAPN
jgi:hypothetical protein